MDFTFFKYTGREHYYEDIDNIASYLANKYSHIGLNTQYYLDYLEKYMWGNYVIKIW